MGKTIDTILEAIGDTPLVPIRRSLPEGAAAVYAKLERYNASGSTKDRIILKIVGAAEAEGRLKPGGTIVAATTGNSGIALAVHCAVKKYRLILTMPENYSLERRRLLQIYGAEVVLTPAAEGLKGAFQRAQELATREPGVLLVDQFHDPLTMLAHAETTVPETVKDLSGEKIHAYVASAGTSGNIMGAALVLRDAGTRIVAVEPEASPFISQGKAGPHKIQGIGPGFLPGFFRRDWVDEVLTVSDREAFATAKELARNEGILAGISCGAAFAAARRVAQRLGKGKIVVTVFPDGGERYFSMEKYFQ